MNLILATEKVEIRSPQASIPIEAGGMRRTFVLHNRQGLHCRPAAFLVNSIKKLACEVTVEANGAVVNGKSIFGLMCLAAGCGTKLAFTITGPEAKEALAVIQCLFESNFADAYDRNHPLSHAQMPVLH
jgi:phosphocarrier protein